MLFLREPADPVKVICVLVNQIQALDFVWNFHEFSWLVADKSVGRQYKIVSWLINIHSIRWAKKDKSGALGNFNFEDSSFSYLAFAIVSLRLLRRQIFSLMRRRTETSSLCRVHVQRTSMGWRMNGTPHLCQTLWYCCCGLWRCGVCQMALGLLWGWCKDWGLGVWPGGSWQLLRGAFERGLEGLGLLWGGCLVVTCFRGIVASLGSGGAGRTTWYAARRSGQGKREGLLNWTKKFGSGWNIQVLIIILTFWHLKLHQPQL